MRAILSLFLMLLLPFAARASEELKLDHAPIDTHDAVSIQRGAAVFVNYCLSCHSAEAMRYSRLQDLGLTEKQIRDNLMFPTAKVGDLMLVAMRKSDAKEWFGIAPPDLSVESRARGADWLYTYLRSFYRDDKTFTGWNNLVLPNVAMPHALWELQGEQSLKIEERKTVEGTEAVPTLTLQSPGKLPPAEYDKLIGDLVNYLVYMGEPARDTRTRIGYAVLLFLGILFVPVYLLKREYWKDVH
jgi:ubiquinol-cytochrome c reductase cytochrome c1 subunit